MLRFWEMMKLTSVSQGSCRRMRIPAPKLQARARNGSSVSLTARRMAR